MEEKTEKGRHTGQNFIPAFLLQSGSLDVNEWEFKKSVS